MVSGLAHCGPEGGWESEMAGDACEEFDGWDEPEAVHGVCGADSVHADEWEVREGVNYLAGWRSARVASARLRKAMTARGLRVERAVWAGVCGDGSGVVRLELDVVTAAALADLVDEA